VTAPDDGYSQGSTLRALGLAEQAAGARDAAHQHLTDSLAHLPAALYPLEHARTCAALAHLLTEEGEVAAAASYAATAHDLLSRLVWSDGPPPPHEALLTLALGPAGPVPSQL
jgi:hypothetical protein